MGRLLHAGRVAIAGALAAVALALSLGAGGCGSGAAAPSGATNSGPGLSTARPPWPPEYAHLPERLHELGLPPVGNEKFHIHAMLHIYVHGLLVPVPANIGREPQRHLEASLHTHDRTGIIHMEATHAYRFTLGDFFTVWGVKLGPAQVGGLKGLGGDKLHFYLNGRPLRDPAAHVLRNGESIVIGYGPPDRFPHTPSIFLLEEVEQGKGGLGCSSVHAGRRHKRCVAEPAPASKAKH
jgi:hypothetical protein